MFLTVLTHSVPSDYGLFNSFLAQLPCPVLANSVDPDQLAAEEEAN